VIGPAGGVVDFAGSTNALVVYTGAAAGTAVSTNTTWAGGSFGADTGVSPLVSIAPGVTLTNTGQLYNGPYRITAGGTYYATAAASPSAAAGWTSATIHNLGWRTRRSTRPADCGTPPTPRAAERSTSMAARSKCRPG